MPGAITISTIGDLIDHDCRMTAWCPKDGNREVDLKLLAERYGRDTTYIRPASPIRIKCAACGNKPLSYVISQR